MMYKKVVVQSVVGILLVVIGHTLEFGASPKHHSRAFDIGQVMLVLGACLLLAAIISLRRELIRRDENASTTR